MSNQMIISPQNELADTSLSPMQLAGQVANHHATKNVFGEFYETASAATERTYARALTLFAEYLSFANVPDIDADCLQNDPECWRGVTYGIVKGFRQWLLKNGHSTTSINNRLSAIRKHAGMAAEAGVISTDDYNHIRMVSGYSDKKAKRINENREVTRIGHKKAEHTSITESQATSLKDWTVYNMETGQGARDLLLMCILLDHGLRCGEVAILKAGDFNLADGTFTFYRPKTDEWSTHEISSDTLQALERYLNVRPENVKDDLLLVGSTRWDGLTNKPMSTRAITKRVKYLGEKLLGVEKLSAHDCRHFFATYWAKRIDRLPRGILQLQEAGGWSSLAMPRRYAENAKIANKGMT